ncbi:MAG: hypothetical protein AAFX05_02890, partial [Planctomycetota bacterium]
ETILVRWDGWNFGSPAFVLSCDCPANPGGGTARDWLVNCTSIGLAVVNNITQGTEYATIADSVLDSNPGDVIELDAHVFNEQNIVLNERDLTFLGQGPDETIIDGGGVGDSIFMIGAGSNISFDGMTMRNGLVSGAPGGGAMQLQNESTTVSAHDVHFIGNETSGTSSGAIWVSKATLNLEDCLFQDNVTGTNGFATDVSVIGAELSAVNCVFVYGVNGNFNVYVQSVGAGLSFASLVNCTFVGTSFRSHVGTRNTFADADVIGCVLETFDSVEAIDGASITISRCVYPGATGDNIDAAPIFVDALNGDYRLAPGSPGIDAADATAYLNAGGGDIDLAGSFRYWDDAGTPNTGIGATNILDCGAFEFQSTSPPQAQCPGDIDGDGDTDLEDFTILASDFGCVPTP